MYVQHVGFNVVSQRYRMYEGLFERFYLPDWLYLLIATV